MLGHLNFVLANFVRAHMLEKEEVEFLFPA